MVLDGNIKNHRDVCKARDAGYTEYEGLPGSIKTGCMNTPSVKYTKYEFVVQIIHWTQMLPPLLSVQHIVK